MQVCLFVKKVGPVCQLLWCFHVHRCSFIIYLGTELLRAASFSCERFEGAVDIVIKCQINPDLCSNACYLGSLPWDNRGGGQFWKSPCA